nr:hypothetical protein [uncultured Flavobacterium sp.]
MKKVSFFIAAVLCSLVFSTGAKAQSSTDYFVGKWNILVVGTPKGDAASIITLERKEGKLTGTIISEGKEATSFSRVEEKDNTLTAYFTSTGYDVYLFMEKKDENNFVGSMMDMFDCTGTRIVETKN